MENTLTIAIPTFRRPEMFLEAFNSALRLQEKSKKIHIIVIDNDPESTVLDQIFAELNSKVRYYKNASNIGMVENWNRCIEKCQTSHITILHDDDILLPPFLNTLKYLHCAIIATSTLAVTDMSACPNIIKKYTKLKIVTRKKLLLKNQFNGTLGVVFSIKNIDSKIKFSQDWYPISDYKFWIDYTRDIESIIVLDSIGGLYRIDQNESLSRETQMAFVEKSRQLRKETLGFGSFQSLVIFLLYKYDQICVDSVWNKKKLSTINLIYIKIVAFLINKRF